jgi:hypothetical protein
MYDYGKAVALGNRRVAEFMRIYGLPPVTTDEAGGLNHLLVPDGEAAKTDHDTHHDHVDSSPKID